MRIGLPKEIKEHELNVDTGAGAGINATDQAYLAAGRLGAIAANPGLRGGPNVRRGHATHPANAASVGFALKPSAAALAA